MLKPQGFTQDSEHQALPSVRLLDGQVSLSFQGTTPNSAAPLVRRKL